MKTRAFLLSLVLAALPLLTLAGDPDQAGMQRSFTLTASELTLANLAGEVRVEGAAGPNFVVEVAVHGDAAAVSRVRVEAKEGDHARLYVQYPFEDEGRFIYPELGRGSSTSFQIHGGIGGKDEWPEWVLPGHRTGRIEVRGSGKGTEVWADVTVKVPAGKKIEVRHGVGRIEAESVTGNVLLDSHSGPVAARSITGDLLVDTGSGSVIAQEIRGDLSVDTGSGSVTLSRCTGDDVLIDTGSGSVDAEDLDCRNLKIDTGSGQVDGTAIKSDRALVDTGSGSIEMSLDRLGEGPYRLDTGSGSIDLRLPSEASARLRADTGSGRIHLDVANARVRQLERTEVALVFGDGNADIVLDTGSGSITIRQ